MDDCMMRLKSISLSEHKEVPFFLLTCEDEPFHGVALINGRFVKTPFFTVKSVNHDKQTAVLTMLVPPPLASPRRMRVLIRTGTDIIVNLNHFCGYSIVPFPICDYFILADLIKDTFCLSFKLDETDLPQILRDDCKDCNFKNTATLILRYQRGKDPFIKVNVYTSNKVIPLTIPKGMNRAIAVPDFRKIEINTPASLVEGEVDFLLNYKRQSKIYFNKARAHAIENNIHMHKTV
jgi:hypothetical protein